MLKKVFFYTYAWSALMIIAVGVLIRVKPMEETPAKPTPPKKAWAKEWCACGDNAPENSEEGAVKFISRSFLFDFILGDKPGMTLLKWARRRPLYVSLLKRRR